MFTAYFQNKFFEKHLLETASEVIGNVITLVK